MATPSATAKHSGAASSHHVRIAAAPLARFEREILAPADL
jgi:hypothetical protein